MERNKVEESRARYLNFNTPCLFFLAVFPFLFARLFSYLFIWR
jgi:hypothetical protein